MALITGIRPYARYQFLSALLLLYVVAGLGTRRSCIDGVEKARREL
eukprot:COSAG02_NODE_2125_length_9747_cov_13.746683_8_plen_46_part_00